MLRLRTLLASLLALCLTIASVPAFAAAPAVKTDVSEQQAKVAAFKDVVSRVKASTVDWKALREAYRAGLQATVRARDTEYNEQLDVTISAAINAGESGELSQAVVAQMVDKLSQKAFALTIKHEFSAAKEALAAGDKAGALAHIDEAVAYFEALRSTVQKRDAAFGTTLEAEIDTALATAQQAVKDGNEPMLYLMQPAVTHNLVLTFYLAVGGYAEKIEKGVATGSKVDGWMSEGWSFYQSILGNVGKRTPDLRAFVDARLNPISGNPALVNAAEIHDAMTAGLFGYVQNYTVAYEKEWDNLKRFHATAEGAIIAKGLVKKVGELFGAETGESYAKAINGWTAAVLADDREAAAAHAKVVDEISRKGQLQVAAAPEGAVVLTVGRATVKADGKWTAIDVATKAGATEADVPLRFVAEALGFQVGWDGAAGVVTLEGNGKAIRLEVGTLGSYNENSRTYVPAAYIREVLGAAYVWDAVNKTITISQ